MVRCCNMLQLRITLSWVFRNTNFPQSACLLKMTRFALPTYFQPIPTSNSGAFFQQHAAFSRLQAAVLLAVSYSERMMNSDNNNKRQVEGQRRAAPRKRVASERSAGERQGAARRGDMGQRSRAGRQEDTPPRPGMEHRPGAASRRLETDRRPGEISRPAAQRGTRPAPRPSASAASTRSSARPSAPASGASRSAERPSARPPARPARSAAPHGTARTSGRPAAPAPLRSGTRTMARASEPARSARSVSAAPTLFGFDLRIIGAVLVVLVVAIVLVVRGCSGSEPSSAASAPAASATPVAEESQVDIEAYRDQVFSWLEDDYAEALMTAAETDADAAWIVSHIDCYAVDGSSVQYKLLKLAATEPQARLFVRNWPNCYPSDQAGSCSSGWDGRVPRLYQWDERWGYTLYCNTTFALTGCCPTSLAMVYQGLTGASDRSPYDLGVMAARGGYMDSFNGTDTAFLTNCASELGLSCRQLSVSSDSITSALSAGEVVICNVGPGDFTTGGHFIVLAGLDNAGDVVVNDPFSAERSAVSWPAQTIAGQTKALYAYSLA